MYMLILADALAIFVVIATSLPLVRKSAWWIRVFDFPRLHFASLGAVALGIYLFLGPANMMEKMLATAAAVSVLYQAFQIFPYTPLSGKQSQTSDRGDTTSDLSILIANVLMTNRESERLIETVRRRQPDVVLLSEPDEWWAGKMAVLDQVYPFRVKYPLDNTYGLILLSRLKLIDPAVRFLVEDAVPSIHVRVELRTGGLVTFYGLHPRPPRPATGGSGKRDTELFLVARETARTQTPVIIAGDLNDVAWSYSTRQFQQISGLLDPRIGRGMYNTFYAGIQLIRFPVDHVFHSKHFRLIQLEREEYFGSDHFPIFVQLQYKPDQSG